MRTGLFFGRGLAHLLAASIILLITFDQVEAKKIFVPGRRAIVFDERVSVLRERPDAKSRVVQRLRRGREIGILASAATRSGGRYLRVAISRNREGWILAESVVIPGSTLDAQKILRLIDETSDDFIRAKLARLCADEFRTTALAPAALLKLGETAERVAERLTRDAGRRLGEDPSIPGVSRRDLFLNFIGLDRFNKIGLTFNYVEDEGDSFTTGRLTASC
ncbi:MAG: SH3 domain-containing protein [Acidobacteria bacterium]|nr:SH3 domain-containing protein [Acidobacteriota bacterium]